MTGIALGVAFLAGAGFGWGAALAVALATGAILGANPGRGRLIVPALAVVLGGTAGAWRGVPPPSAPALIWVDAAGAVRGRVETPPTAHGRYQRFELTVEAVAIGDDWTTGAGQVCATAPAFPTLALGDRVRLAGNAVPIQDQPAEARAFLRSRGCGASLFAVRADVEAAGRGWRRDVAAARRELSEVLRRAAPGDAGALLSGLVTGDDHALSEARRDAFVRTGTTHITAVSGANLALVLTVATTLGTATGWRRRLGWQLPTLAAVWGYALLVGLGPPALRAALVATAAVFASRVGRWPDFVTLTVVAGAAMVAARPELLWGLSFQLSFASALALAAVLPGLAPVGLGGWLKAALLAGVVAQVATLPILLPAFGRLSPLSLPANLLIGPLVGVAFPLAVLAGALALVWAPLGEAVAVPARLCAAGIFGVVDALGGPRAAVVLAPASRPLTMVLVAVAASAAAAASRDGRAWAGRLPEAAATATPRVRAVALGGIIGGAVATARWLA